MLLFMNGHDTQNTPLVSSSATQSTDPPHLNAMQSPLPAAAAAHAPEVRPPSPIVPSQQHAPASAFDGGVRASQLQEYCRCVRMILVLLYFYYYIWCAGLRFAISSAEFPEITRDVISHLASRKNDMVSGSFVQQLHRSGGFVGRPTVIVCHSHDAAWKETIGTVCKFCR